MIYTRISMPSKTQTMVVTVDVLLPNGPAPQGGWPVLYVLHGYSDDQTAWPRWTTLEHKLEQKGVAAVFASGYKSFYVNMAQGERMFDFFADELPRTLGQMFYFTKDPAKTYIMGNSMGGYGSFLLALSRPEQYGAAVSFSGVLDIAKWIADREDRAELARTFGEQPDMARLDLMQLVDRLPDDAGPRLYACCGSQDFLLESNHKFNQHMQGKNRVWAYDEQPGSHDWDYWEKMLDWALEKLLNG